MAQDTGTTATKDDKTVTTAGSQNDNNAGIVIPDEAKKKHPEIVELILQSESMNTEERNYWLQVLPVMTPDQVTELRDILETEKRKLAAIDAKYAAKKDPAGQAAAELSAEDLQRIEEERRKKQQERKQKEATHREQDDQKAEDLLSQLDDL